ncbi:hypothetical protein [Microtetraspora sp. NBRC 16547]|uniref:hypothetical protein n=1 Tax=Microtetraspora sp. NBRC 16547 TaxID=3030993 RepID=UPI00249FB2CB|nr:hypothetical protein [Microtetraspora sp. NBRC 16547]GLW98438.1 hypothetical protein Misp02_25250 [Microtetraspora sp. NBRC 16547]
MGGKRLPANARSRTTLHGAAWDAGRAEALEAEIANQVDVIASPEARAAIGDYLRPR